MQRVAILVLCAIAAVAILWFLVRPGDSGHESDGGQQAGSVAGTQPPSSNRDRAASRPGAGSEQALESAGEGAGAGELAPHAAATGSSTGSARLEASDAPAAAARPGAGRVGQPGELESDAEAPSPSDAERAGPLDSQAQRPALMEPDSQTPSAASEPAFTAEGDGDAGSPSGRGTQATVEGGVLTPQEIARRVEKALPDGSLPPDELAAARKAQADLILQRSKTAAGLTHPRTEPSVSASSSSSEAPEVP